MKLFNIFTKKQEIQQEETEPDILSAITFSIDETGEVFVDIRIDNTDKDSLISLSTVLATMSAPESPSTVLEMIKASLIADDKTDEYITFITDFMVRTEALIEGTEERTKEEPCINPSDMI